MRPGGMNLGNLLAIDASHLFEELRSIVVSLLLGSVKHQRLLAYVYLGMVKECYFSIPQSSNYMQKETIDCEHKHSSGDNLKAVRTGTQIRMR